MDWKMCRNIDTSFVRTYICYSKSTIIQKIAIIEIHEYDTYETDKVDDKIFFRLNNIEYCLSKAATIYVSLTIKLFSFYNFMSNLNFSNCVLVF